MSGDALVERVVNLLVKWHARDEDADHVAHVEAENARLRAAILDIDAHATPLGEDKDGFVTGGYLVSVGSLHRAIGVVRQTLPGRVQVTPQ